MESRNRNHEMLKLLAHKKSLKELVVSHTCPTALPSVLLAQTTNPELLALKLHKKGVLSDDEMEQFLTKQTAFTQNFEIYRLVNTKNAGDALIDALFETKNYKILDFFLQKKLNSILESPPDQDSLLESSPSISTIPKSREETKKEHEISAQVSILKSKTKVNEYPANEWFCQLTGDDNLSILDDDFWPRTLARVVTTTTSMMENSETAATNCVKVSEFYPEEEEEAGAIIKFLESQLDLSLDKKTVGHPPLQIFINARSFSFREWTTLSKLLLLCRDSLENLWLENVDCKEYCSGTNWMKTLGDENSLEKSELRFTRLKSFIIQGTEGTLSAETFHNLLVLIKPLDYPISDLWKNSGCKIQIARKGYENVHIILDPSNATLLSSKIADDLKDQVDEILGQKSSEVTKLHYNDPRAELIKNEVNAQVLTHFFITFEPTISNDTIQTLLTSLSEFKVLEKLFLSGNSSWTMDLKYLDVLDRLSVVYFYNANLGGVVVDTFSWRKSMQIVTLDCGKGYKLNAPGLESLVVSDACLVLERNLEKNFKAKPQRPFNFSLLPKGEAWHKAIKQFCN